MANSTYCNSRILILTKDKLHHSNIATTLKMKEILIYMYTSRHPILLISNWVEPACIGLYQLVFKFSPIDRIILVFLGTALVSPPVDPSSTSTFQNFSIGM